MKNLGAIVLAAGQGKRINSQSQNKVLLTIKGKPLISYTYDLLTKLKIKKVVVVVGFAKESVINFFKEKVQYAIQENPAGTADAAKTGLLKMPSGIDKVLVMYGDHSFFYTPKMIKGLISFQKNTNFPAVIITVDRKDPFNYGRIIRSKKGTISQIVEEKDATPKQKEIKEINTGFYLFDCNFLRKYLPRIKRNPISNEFYLTDIVKLAVSDGIKVAAFKVKDENVSVGVNTKDQLAEAEEIMRKIHAK